MKYRRFGRTEMRLSVFTLGLMRYMRDPDESARIVERAVELGINHLETARGYGTSEALLGRALPAIDRSKVYITTKARPAKTYDVFMKAFDTSMANLGVDYLDNFDLHGINNAEMFEMAMRRDGTWRAVERLLDQGVIRHIGFSTHGPLDIILKTIETQAFESVNLHYYYFFQVNEPAVVRAAELDMGVFIISPNDKGGMLATPPTTLAGLAAPFHPMNLNARWLLSRPEVHTLSLGPDKLSDFDRHLRVADADGPLSAEEAEAVGRWDGRFRAVLGCDLCTICGECLPCPEDVNIPETLRLRMSGRQPNA